MSVTPDQAAASTPAEGDLDLSARIARAAPLQRPGLRLSRNAILAIVTVFVLVGVTAGIVDNYLGAHVGAPPPARTPSSSAAPPASVIPGPPRHGLAGMMGLATARGLAPGFRLTDQAGRSVSLAGLRGKVVVLSFFDADCNDLCPVLAAELRAADRRLGAERASVAFVTVNTDPLRTGRRAAAEGARTSRLGGLSNWYFLSGSLRKLDAVWQRYGITIDVQRATGLVSHNEAMWFIRPSGALAEEATPFGDEHPATGTFTLPAATEARFGAGIARYARDLITDPSRGRADAIGARP